MAAHIGELVREFDIEAIVGENLRPRGGSRRRHIVIKPVRSETTYWVALHEIAHALGKGNSDNRLHQEVSAWQWALDHALSEPTPAIKAKIAKALRSYHHRALRWKSMKLPEADHAFWQMIEEFETEPPFRVYSITDDEDDVKGFVAAYPGHDKLLLWTRLGDPRWLDSERVDLGDEYFIESLSLDLQLWFFDHVAYVRRLR